ncbi:MAG: hypothetical protein K0R57_5478 [Paenibacillaceae bacterium]|jgi:YesN/AraC family two-component response regulator|nr:hypothetical protein [Paenibacillaceae bacterium]
MVDRLRGSYLMKLVMSHLMLMCMILAVGGGMLLSRTAAMMDEEMQRSGVNQLSMLQERLEQQELEKYNALLLNKALSTVRQEAESEIQYFLDNGKEDNYYRINRLTQDLKTLSISLPSLHNLSYYFMKDDFLVDRYFYESPANSPQAELLASGRIPLHQWFLRTVADTTANKDTGQPALLKVLTYIHTLPYMAKSGQIKGYMIIDLDAEKLIGNLGNHLGSRNEKLAVLDGSGQMIGASSAWDTSMLGQVREQLSAGIYSILKQEEQVISLLPAAESAFGWNYVLLRQQNALILTTEKMKQDIGLAALAIFALGGALAYMVSRWCYSTFRYMTQRVRALTGQFMTSGLVSEIGWLDQALRRLDQQQKKYASNLLMKQWRELIQGSAAYGEEEMFIPKGNSFLAVSLELYGMDQAACAEYLRALQSEAALQGEYIPMSATEAVLVYWSELPDDHELEGAVILQLNEVAERIEGPFRYAAGIGGAVSKPEDIHLSVAEAETARRYGFLEEGSMAIRYREVEQRKDYFTQVKPEQLDTLLRAGEPSALEQFLAECETDLRTGNYSIDAVELALMQLHLSISKAKMMLEGSGEAQAYVRGATLGDSFAKLKGMAVAIAYERLEKRNDRYERILNAIRLYVDNHLHEEISLETLTEITSYSKQYICKLFKDEMQTTFVDYLTLRRLERAAELLCQTEDPAVLIAERSGFGSSQYFSRKFKAHYGVTPVQYRQANGNIQIVPNRFKMNN